MKSHPFNEAESQVRKAITAFEKLNINTPERHHVTMEGMPATTETSLTLLNTAIKESKKTSLYMGINICPSICTFCRYLMKTAAKTKMKQMIKEYIDNLVKEINLVQSHIKTDFRPYVNSLYLGGGTPTLVNTQYIKRLMDVLSEYYCFDSKTEITIEGTPDTVTDQKVIELQEIGINRISMGVQQMNDHWLKSVNRGHTTQDVYSALEVLQETGIKYNVDLMYGFKGQTPEEIQHNIEIVNNFNPTEITLYRLEDQKRPNDKTIKIEKANSQDTYLMQQEARRLLTELNFEEAPSGWYTRKHHKTSQVYTDRWKNQIPLIAFGPDAYSFSRYQQHSNHSWIPQDIWGSRINAETLPINTEKCFEYSQRQQKIRKMIFELKYFKTLPSDFAKPFFQKLCQNNLGRIEDKMFVASNTGKIIIEEIIHTLTKMI